MDEEGVLLELPRKLCHTRQLTWNTIRAKMITEMRGADFIVFRINEIRQSRNLMRFFKKIFELIETVFEINSLAGLF